MRLLKKYFSMHLKTALEYKSQFILTAIAQGLYLLAELLTVYSLFQKFSLLDEYNPNILLLNFSVMWASFSLSEMFLRGFDNFSNLIITGNFDTLLIRPRSLFIQIVGSDICYEKLLRVALSLGIYIYSACQILNEFSLIKILLLILMIIGLSFIIVSLFIIGATFAFYTIQGIEIINVFTNGTKQVGEFPLKMYNKVVKFIFLFIIPIGFINYFPIDYLIGNSNNILYILSPLVGIIPFIISLFIFKLGLKKYASSGS